MLRRKVLRLATALGFVISSVAVAQDAATPPPAAAPQSAVVGEAPAKAPAAKGDEERTEEIVVTGTRIKRKDLSTPAPVTVINREQITASGKVSIGDFLQSMPEQGNAINTAVNNGGDGATRVNLRGIGVNRTLVLVNGRRWVPGGTGADASVDLNSIPSAVVERVEVLKDGASAVYGSDAIAGVVNIITRRTGDKTDASFYTGASGHGDGTTFDVNLTTGTGSDRGNILFSAGYFDQRKVMAGDRDFSKIAWYYDATGNNNANGTVGPYSSGSGTIPAGRTLNSGGTGTTLWNNLVAGGGGSFIWDGGPAGTDTGYNGTNVYCGLNALGQNECFRKYQGSGLREAGNIGDGYNYAPYNYLVTPQQRIQLFSTGDLRLGSFARGYFEASYVNRQSGQVLAPEPFVMDGESVGGKYPNGIVVSADNVYNPFGTDVQTRRRMSEFGNRVFGQNIDTFRIVGGIDGTLPESTGPVAGWFWDVNAQYGNTSGTSTKQGSLYTPGLADALGPSMVIGGRPTCVSKAGDATTAIPGCVPLNMYGGPGSITPDQVAGLTFTGTSHGSNELRSIQANTSGELFRLPTSDRPTGLALGYEYRDLFGNFINDPMTAKGFTTGNKGLDTSGGYYVNEVYAELSIPILSNMPFAEDLEATLAARWFDYSTFGSDTTYKLGAKWRPFGDVTLRGTYSTAFRAPNIAELYGGQADNFASVKDPCRGPAAGGPAVSQACLDAGVPAGGSGDTSSQLHSTVGGNPALGAETAKVYTIGVVFEPRWVRNLSFTLDYYNTAIDKNIGSYGESVLLTGCYNGSHPEYCSRITRNSSTHYVDNIININANVGKLDTSGLDFAINYALPTPSWGRFGFLLNATWLQEINQTLADGTVVHGRNTFDLNTLNSNGGAGGSFPEWKFNAGLTWAFGGLGAGISTRFLSSFHECGDSGGDFSGSGLCYVDATYQRKVSSYHTEDIFVSYNLGWAAGKSSVMAGVQNISNAPPAKIYNGFASSTDQYNYDQMGRFFYLRLAQSY